MKNICLQNAKIETEIKFFDHLDSHSNDMRFSCTIQKERMKKETINEMFASVVREK